jgi:hypothetical protein
MNLRSLKAQVIAVQKNKAITSDFASNKYQEKNLRRATFLCPRFFGLLLKCFSIEFKNSEHFCADKNKIAKSVQEFKLRIFHIKISAREREKKLIFSPQKIAFLFSFSRRENL